MIQQEINKLNQLIEGPSIETAFETLIKLFPSQITFSTSLSFEDQIITHYIFDNNFPITIFTLDTGRLFNETFAVLSATLDRYKGKIKVYYPQTESIQNLVSLKGPNSFYESIENRKECCYFRKVEPLKRALKGNRIWITGIRGEHSETRKQENKFEWDERNQIIKFHPILDWKIEKVLSEIKLHNIPYNSLHDKGFSSIGCAPCTRAVKNGDDFRSGRWWWENNEKKECGLHNN